MRTYKQGSQRKDVITTDLEQNRRASQDEDLEQRELEAQRQTIRENARRVIKESGLSEMLRSINTNQLKGRGRFEEYDSMILFKWGTGYTLRHIWIEIVGNTIRFRLRPHLKCTQPAPLCDGEYHTLTSAMWSNQTFLRAELKRYYDRPVAETSSD